MRRPVILAAIVLAIAVAGVSFAAKGGGSKEVTLCAAKKGGALTLAAKGRCGKGQKKLVIAKEGPAGAAGPAGTAGPQGAPGPAGTTASIQPEAVHLVAPTPGPTGFDCATAPATFCTSSAFSWANFGEGFASAGFQKDAAGYVHLQGTVKVVSIPESSGGFNETRIFVLPGDYRPAETRLFTVPCETGFTAKAVTLAVDSDGSIEVDSQACGFGDPIGLDGVSYYP